MKTILTALLMTCAFAASAQGIPANSWMEEVKPVLSRAEVLAELTRSRSSGEFAALQAEAFDFRVTAGDTRYAARPLTRQEVMAQLTRSRLSGEFDVLNAEAHDFGPQVRLTRFASIDPARTPPSDASVY